MAIERQHELAELAAERMERLGYDNVRIVEGDGTADGPRKRRSTRSSPPPAEAMCPQALIDQLKPGGRLVMPLGEPVVDPVLVKVTKRADGRVEREELGAVRFVPLIEAGIAGQSQFCRSEFRARHD